MAIVVASWGTPHRTEYNRRDGAPERFLALFGGTHGSGAAGSPGRARLPPPWARRGARAPATRHTSPRGAIMPARATVEIVPAALIPRSLRAAPPSRPLIRRNGAGSPRGAAPRRSSPRRWRIGRAH